MAEADQTKERMDFLRKRLLTMEWDKRMNQFNAGMEEKFRDFKKEYEELSKKTPSGETPPGQ